MTNPYAPYFKLEKEDYIAKIILSRPEKYNTIAYPFWETLVKLQAELVSDKSVRCVVILAEGKHFSAGTDLDDLKHDRKESEFGNGRALYKIQDWQRGFQFFGDFDIPVICGLQGACIGSAIEWVAAADFRIASDNFNTFMGEVKSGMCSDLGGTTRLTQLIGRSQALRLLLTAERIGAEEALRIGLVDKVVPLDELEETVMNMARTITKMSPFAVMTTKRVVRITEEGGVTAGLAAERINSGFCTQTNDRLIAIRAMMNKADYNPEFNLD